MVEMKNFLFYGAPIKIETEKWRIEFISSPEYNTSTIEITKNYHWGRDRWAFRVVKNDDKLASYPTICSVDDPIGKCIWRLEELSIEEKLDWYAVDAMFLSIITYLNE